MAAGGPTTDVRRETALHRRVRADACGRLAAHRLAKALAPRRDHGLVGRRRPSLRRARTLVVRASGPRRGG
ncbi:hypothetical protein PSCLAVI8L_180249 [Pseudoclavibacter sp. 8L]|nr:hypothetical protein PSCLAVI8L_180249 [Pseudoclavibacter sp. 8L]